MSNPTTFELSNLANVSGPDRGEGHPDGPSVGALWLRQIHNTYVDALSYDEIPEDDDMGERNDKFHELADGSVPIYNGERWQVFTDLAAWQEVETYTAVAAWDTKEIAHVDGLDLSGDMTDMAGQVLCAIALRLLNALYSADHDEDGNE